MLFRSPEAVNATRRSLHLPEFGFADDRTLVVADMAELTTELMWKLAAKTDLSNVLFIHVSPEVRGVLISQMGVKSENIYSGSDERMPAAVAERAKKAGVSGPTVHVSITRSNLQGGRFDAALLSAVALSQGTILILGANDQNFEGEMPVTLQNILIQAMAISLAVAQSA